MSLPYLTTLTAQDLRTHNIPEPWRLGMADRVRFGEIDVLGHVNNTAYLSWFESLRIHYFGVFGVADYSGTPPKLVVRNLGVDFISEVKLNDSYILTGRTVEMRNSSFTMNYGVFVDGKLTTTGHAVIVTLNDDNTKRPLSDTLRAAFIRNDGAVQA